MSNLELIDEAIFDTLIVYVEGIGIQITSVLARIDSCQARFLTVRLELDFRRNCEGVARMTRT